MIYVMGILGFIGGFIFGQMLLFYVLRHKSREDLLRDQYIKWTYGLLNWIIAGLGAYSFIVIYKQYF